MMFLHGNDKIWIVFTMMMMMFIIINNKSSFYIVFVEKIYLLPFWALVINNYYDHINYYEADWCVCVLFCLFCF